MDSKSYIKKLNSNWQVNTCRSNDDVVLRYALFRNSRKPMRRCIVYIHGRTEWIEKNMEIPEWLGLPDDCGYLTWDLRGQGASGGERAWIDHYDTYLADAQNIIEEALPPKIPIAILSHSTGGLIALYGTLKGVFKPFSLVASSPLLGLRNEPVPRLIAKPLSKLLSALSLGKFNTGVGAFEKFEFETNQLTHDYDMFNVIKNSPYRIPSACFGWVSATFQAVDYVHRHNNIMKLSAPTLILQASGETVVSPELMSSWVANAQTLTKVDVRCDLIHGARHEIFSEIPKLREQGIAKTKFWFKTFLD